MPCPGPGVLFQVLQDQVASSTRCPRVWARMTMTYSCMMCRSSKRFTVHLIMCNSAIDHSPVARVAHCGLKPVWPPVSRVCCVLERRAARDDSTPRFCTDRVCKVVCTLLISCCIARSTKTRPNRKVLTLTSRTCLCPSLSSIMEVFPRLSATWLARSLELSRHPVS
jgi:hypothetical protein